MSCLLCGADTPNGCIRCTRCDPDAKTDPQETKAHWERLSEDDDDEPHDSLKRPSQSTQQYLRERAAFLEAEYGYALGMSDRDFKVWRARTSKKDS